MVTETTWKGLSNNWNVYVECLQFVHQNTKSMEKYRKIQFSFFHKDQSINQSINFFKYRFKTFLRHCFIRMKFHFEIRKRSINEHLGRRAATTESTNQLHSWGVVVVLFHNDVIILTRLMWFESKMYEAQFHASSKWRVQSPNAALRVWVLIRIPWRAETPMRNVKYTPTPAFFWWHTVVIDFDGWWIRVLKIKKMLLTF